MTGAKLAYAAPLVAASMRLSAGGAAAISPDIVVDTCAVAGCPATAHLADGSELCTSRVTPLDSLVACCDATTPCTGENDHDCVIGTTDSETGVFTPKVCPTSANQGICQTVVICG